MIPARRLAKRLGFAIGLLLVSPLALAALLERRLSASEAVFVACGQLLALVPGTPGSFLRVPYYFATLDRCSWEVRIGFGSFFSHRAAVLGRFVSLGSWCVVGCADIQSGTMIASRVSVTSGRRQHLDDAGLLCSQPVLEQVHIGARTWVGEGAIILADVGAECIVSAGAVVLRDVPDHSVVAGNPAQVLRSTAAAGRTTGSSDRRDLTCAE